MVGLPQGDGTLTARRLEHYEIRYIDLVAGELPSVSKTQAGTFELSTGLCLRKGHGPYTCSKTHRLRGNFDGGTAIPPPAWRFGE